MKYLHMLITLQNLNNSFRICLKDMKQIMFVEI